MLADLAVPLAQMGWCSKARNQRIRAELAAIREWDGVGDVRPQFGDVREMSEISRDLLHVYVRAYEPEAVDAIQTMLTRSDRSALDDEFERVGDDADEAQSQRLTEG